MLFVGAYCRGQRREDQERDYLENYYPENYYPTDERIPCFRLLPETRTGGRGAATAHSGDTVSP